MTWSDITIGQYQRMYPVLIQPAITPIDQLEQQLELISILDGRPKEHYESLTAKAFRLITDHYRFAFTPPEGQVCPKNFTVRGIKFHVDYDPTNVQTRLKARDIVDLTTLANEDGVIIANINRIVGAYVRPSRKFGIFKRNIDVDKILLDLDMQTAVNITAFFLPLLEACLPHILDYSKAQLEKMGQSITDISGVGT